MGSVLGEDAAAIVRLRWRPVTQPFGDVDAYRVDRAVGDVHSDDVAVAERRQRTAHRRLRRVAPEKRPSVIRHTDSPRPCPTSAPVTCSISRMPGPPFGPSYLMTTVSPAWT